MIFFSNYVLISFITTIVLFKFASSTTNISFFFTKLNPLVFNSNIIVKFLKTLHFTNWKPLFKRSSYIGLVWKTHWKL